MTIGVAVRGTGGFHLATDTQVCRGTQIEHLTAPKIISAGHVKILYSGQLSLCQDLTEFTNGDDAEVVAIQIAAAIRKRRGRSRGRLDVEFLICDGTKMVAVDGHAALVMVRDDFSCVGETEVAKGAMWATSRTGESGHAVAYSGVRACIALSAGCGGEVMYVWLPAAKR